MVKYNNNNNNNNDDDYVDHHYHFQYQQNPNQTQTTTTTNTSEDYAKENLSKRVRKRLSSSSKLFSACFHFPNHRRRRSLSTVSFFYPFFFLKKVFD